MWALQLYEPFKCINPSRYEELVPIFFAFKFNIMGRQHCKIIFLNKLKTKWYFPNIEFIHVCALTKAVLFYLSTNIRSLICQPIKQSFLNQITNCSSLLPIQHYLLLFHIDLIFMSNLINIINAVKKINFIPLKLLTKKRHQASNK